LNSFIRTEGAFYTKWKSATLIKQAASNEARLTEDEIGRAHFGDRGFLVNRFPSRK